MITIMTPKMAVALKLENARIKNPAQTATDENIIRFPDMLKGFFKRRFFVHQEFEFMIVTHEIVNDIVDRHADRNAGDQAGHHRKLDAEPSHHAEIDHDGNHVRQNGDPGNLK